MAGEGMVPTADTLPSGWSPGMGSRKAGTLALAAMGLGGGGGSYCEVICKRVIKKRKDSGAQRCLCHLIQAYHS